MLCCYVDFSGFLLNFSKPWYSAYFLCLVFWKKCHFFEKFLFEFLFLNLPSYLLRKKFFILDDKICCNIYLNNSQNFLSIFIFIYYHFKFIYNSFCLYFFLLICIFIFISLINMFYILIILLFLIDFENVFLKIIFYSSLFIK